MQTGGSGWTRRAAAGRGSRGQAWNAAGHAGRGQGRSWAPSSGSTWRAHAQGAPGKPEEAWKESDDVRPVGIVGGGLAGLACGWALRQRGLPSVVLDTGRRGPGGRASSRVLEVRGQPQVVDHAVQCFTVQTPEVRNVVEKMERSGAVQRWRGTVGTLHADGRFQDRDEAAEGPLWIGGSEHGLGGMCSWLAGQQEVVKDVWVARLNQLPDGGWDFSGQRNQQVAGGRSFSYVVMAHNGKCADRLINTAPMRTAAHAPLKCKFTDKPSAVSDRLELSSLWVCVVALPRRAAAFEGAFIEGSSVLSWAGNNSAKYKRASGAATGLDAWTLISTPRYGAANKCPQEAIPHEVRVKVSAEMQDAFARLLRVEQSGWEVLHLQLWGAAVPLNVCGQHFVHDKEARVGICGDWLTAPSVDGALYSGLALAAAIDTDLRGGGVATTPVKPFHGLSGHAIGSFDAGAKKPEIAALVEEAEVGRLEAAEAGQKRAWPAKEEEEHGQEPRHGKATLPAAEEAPGSTVAPSAAGKSRWRRKAPAADAPSQGSSEAPAAPLGAAEATTGEEGAIWHFGFGANINPWKLREKRRIRPLEETPGRLPGWRLVFNHKGGMGNIEPLRSVPATDGGPDAVHGMLLYLTPKDFKRLAEMEYEYGTEEVTVEAYDGRAIQAQAFISMREWRLDTYPAPPERYLKLIQDGCTTMKIDPAYQAWLATLPSIRGQRGPEYWESPGQAPAQRRGAPGRGQQQPDLHSQQDGPLKLRALREFAAPAPLVDIGANLGKCSPQDLAAQLVRAAAARVSHMLLTGCSVRGSQDSKRLCEQWSGPEGLRAVSQHLGAAARQELESAGIQELPALAFTAGVHPHDAKSWNASTLRTLRGLAEHRQCVSLGECGLDYDRMFSPREAQLECFRSQVRLAEELGMPLFIHERDRDPGKGPALGSHRDLMAILEESKVRPGQVCVHCFTGSASMLQAYVAQGYFIGLTGFVGMRGRGQHIREALSSGLLPLERLMLETDAPFMLPDKGYVPPAIGVQGRKNEPCVMPGVCQAVAECLGQPAEEVARATTRNACQFFSL